MEKVSALEAARLLSVSIDDLRTLEEQGLIHSIPTPEGGRIYSSEEITHIKSRRGPTLSEQADQVAALIEQETVTSLASTRQLLMVAGGVLAVYVLLVGVFTVSFMVSPLSTARFLGYVRATPETIAYQPDVQGKVLAATTDTTEEKPSLLQTFFQPVGNVSLHIVKFADPRAYEEVATLAILDPNDVLGLDANGSMIPARPISLPDSSLLQVGNNGLVANLNSEYLQGKKPGTEVGDIALVTLPASETSPEAVTDEVPGLPDTGAVVLPAIPGLPDTATLDSSLTLPPDCSVGEGLQWDGSDWVCATFLETLPSISGLTVSNFNTAGISQWTNDAGYITSTSISGLTVLNFGSADISQWTNDAGYIADSSTDVLTNKTISALSNTISDLTAVNLTAGDFSPVITSGTYTINISGSAGSATNFSGSLAGDVTGTQGATTVGKINGATLGTTTATGGNILIGDGLTWATQPLSGDATLTSGGVLTLKNTGTPGSYGSALNIPVFTTDAQGRVTSVTNTTISGLTNAHLSGTAGITNANLANSSIATSGNSGSGSVSLGGGLTFTGSGITNIVASGSTLTVTSTEADTLASVTGRGATTTVALTLSNIANAITAGTLTATGGTINGITIGASTPSTGAFTTLSSTGTTNLGQGTGVIALNSSGALNLTGASASTWTLANVANSLNFDTNTLSLDALNNRVGIGTAAPGFGLSVLGNTSSGNIANITNLNTTSVNTNSVLRLSTGVTGSSNQARFVQFYAGATTDSDGTTAGHINLNNNAVQYTTSGADLAEYVDVTGTVADGDIIASLSAGNQKAVTGELVLGVVTDTAGFVGNYTTASGTAIVGMLGRVNTKVSNENGNIAIGDPISASSVAGVGMKQTKAGPTIGKALAAKTGATVERIAVQVVPGWYDPDPLLTPSSFTLSGSDVLDQNLAIVTRVGGFQDIFAGNVNVAGGLTLDTGALNLTGTSGVLTLSGLSTSSISTATSGNLSLTTGTTGAITLDSGTTGNVNLGNGSNAKTVTIGNTTGATVLNLNSGSGNINFTVDGTGSSGKVQIGNSGTTTPDLLVLDNGTADPTGVNGGMYYNTSTGKFRCFENSAWTNCTGNASDIQHAASYDTNEALTNIPTGGAQVTLGTVSVTPTTANGDVYVTGWADVYSSNATDQPLQVVIETTSNCTGTTVGNANVTYTITSGASTTVDRGTIRVSGIAVDAGASAHAYSLCAAVTSGAGDTDVLNWGMEAIVIDTGADLAEVYTTNDSTIEVGDVVSLDPTLKTGMKKSQTAYDQNVLGIVSTRPGLVIGDVDKEGVTALPVALSGRVPVNVSTENGNIRAGDYLTTSSTPGVAMRSTQAGTIIGTAMSSFEGDNIGQILVFVKNGYSTGSSLKGGKEDLPLPTEKIGSEATLSGGTVEAEREIEKNILDQIAQVVSDVFKNTVEFFGSVIFHSDVTFLGRPTFTKDTAGHAFIKAGNNEVSVAFEKEYAHNPVVTANVNLVEGTVMAEVPPYAIYDVSSKGFKIKLSRAAPFDLNFSWVALSVPESNDPDHSVLTIPTPSPTPTAIPSLTPSPSEEPTVSETPEPETVAASPTPLPSEEAVSAE